jgi:hypothetical protein
VRNPLPFDLPDGGPHAALLIVFAREGTAYLLDRAELGGVDHPLGVQQVAFSGIITSPAAYHVGHDAMVAFQANGSSCPTGIRDEGVVALRISGGPEPAMHTAWCAKLLGFAEGAMVTTSNDEADPIVWIVGAEGDERLHGFRGDTGQEVFKGDPLPGLRHFVTILAAAGRLYVAGDGRIFAFGLAHSDVATANPTPPTNVFLVRHMWRPARHLRIGHSTLLPNSRLSANDRNTSTPAICYAQLAVVPRRCGERVGSTRSPPSGIA